MNCLNIYFTLQIINYASSACILQYCKDVNSQVTEKVSRPFSQQLTIHNSRSKIECAAALKANNTFSAWKFNESTNSCQLGNSSQPLVGYQSEEQLIFASKELRMIIFTSSKKPILLEIGTSQKHDISCPTIPDLPFFMNFSVATVMEGKGYVCGGKGEKRCLMFDFFANQWIETGSMDMARALAAGVLLSDNKWWIAGGQAPDLSWTESTIIYQVDGTYEPGPDMPSAGERPCLTRINATHFYMASNGAISHIFNILTNEWTVLPILKGLFHSCIVLDDEIIIPLFSDDGRIKRMKLQEGVWKWGNPVPWDTPYYYKNIVPFRDTFLVFAGFPLTDKIFHYVKETDSWIERPEKYPPVSWFFPAFWFMNC